MNESILSHMFTQDYVYMALNLSCIHIVKSEEEILVTNIFKNLSQLAGGFK